MDVLIIYHSEHHGNTEKIARAMGKELKAEVVPDLKIGDTDFQSYDLIGFGSGVYHSKFSENMYRIAEKIGGGKQAFIFSTAGYLSYGRRANELFENKLKQQGFTSLGDYTCLGLDTKIKAEGINRSKPDASDIRNAQEFAKNLLK